MEIKMKRLLFLGIIILSGSILSASLKLVDSDHYSQHTSFFRIQDTDPLENASKTEKMAKSVEIFFKTNYLKISPFYQANKESIWIIGVCLIFFFVSLSAIINLTKRKILRKLLKRSMIKLIAGLEKLLQKCA